MIEFAGKVIAAIDIGSNSAHLVIARVDDTGHMDLLDTDKVVLRLGKSLEETGQISTSAMERTLAALKRMQHIIAAYPAIIRVVGTYASREAKNFVDFVGRVREETGLNLEIVDGLEEARLIFLGMHQGLNLKNLDWLGVDVGGGSTEIILGSGRQDLDYVSSLKLGAVTLTHRFRKKRGKGCDLRSLCNYIEQRIGPVQQEVLSHGFRKAIISSGTAKALATIRNNSMGLSLVKSKHGQALSAEDINEITDVLNDINSPEKIAKKFNLDLARAEIIVCGANILRIIGEAFAVDSWTVSSYGLREGLVVDTFDKMLARSSKSAGQSISWRNVVKTGKRFHLDEDHSLRVMQTSLSIYDQLLPLQAPGESLETFMSERQLLACAAYLHEVGKVIGFSGLHKHGAYLVSNTQLLGFTQTERFAIALIIRYHRKNFGEVSRKDAQIFNNKQFTRIVFLSTILRVAAGLQRTRRNLVSKVDVKLNDDELDFCIWYPVDLEPQVEIQKLREDREIISLGLGKKIKVNSKGLSPAMV